MAISHCYSHLVINNGNFTLLLISTGQECHFTLLLTSSGQIWHFTLLRTSSGQQWQLTEWQFHTATDI